MGQQKYPVVLAVQSGGGGKHLPSRLSESSTSTYRPAHGEVVVALTVQPIVALTVQPIVALTVQVMGR